MKHHLGKSRDKICTDTNYNVLVGIVISTLHEQGLMMLWMIYWHKQTHADKSSASYIVYTLYARSHGWEQCHSIGHTCSSISWYRQQYEIGCAATEHQSWPVVHTVQCVRNTSDVVKSLTTLLVMHIVLCVPNFRRLYQHFLLSSPVKIIKLNAVVCNDSLQYIFIRTMFIFNYHYI